MGLIARLGVAVTALIAVLVGSLLADVPGKLGFWNYLDSKPFWKGAIPIIHNGPWGFNYTSLGPNALHGRTFLVTGANSGLGYGTVHYLATHGGRVILGCRSQKNCDDAVRGIKKDAPSADLVPLVLDLASFKSISHFAEEVHQKTQALHSLILNAGLGSGGARAMTKDGIEQIIGVNHFGHAYLVELLVDLLKKTATKDLPANIVVVSSGLHMMSYTEGVRLSIEALNDESTYHPEQAYGQSKLANVLYAQEQAQRLKPFNILVNSVHPGVVETNIESPWVTFPQNHPIITSFLENTGILNQIKSTYSKLTWNFYDGALSQVYLAVSPEVLSKGITGKYYHPIARETPVDPVHGTNTSLRTKLWEFTQEVLKAKAR